jgi:hypothetical protein
MAQLRRGQALLGSAVIPQQGWRWSEPKVLANVCRERMLTGNRACNLMRLASFAEWISPMLKRLTVVFGLVAGLSACAAPYGYTGYGNTGYGYTEPAYYGPVYYGPGYYPIHTSPHGTVQ